MAIDVCPPPVHLWDANFKRNLLICSYVKHSKTCMELNVTRHSLAQTVALSRDIPKHRSWLLHQLNSSNIMFESCKHYLIPMQYQTIVRVRCVWQIVHFQYFARTSASASRASLWWVSCTNQLFKWVALLNQTDFITDKLECKKNLCVVTSLLSSSIARKLDSGWESSFWLRVSSGTDLALFPGLPHWHSQ